MDRDENYDNGYEEALAALDELLTEDTAPPAADPEPPSDPAPPEDPGAEDDDLIPDPAAEQPSYVTAEDLGTLQAQMEAFIAQVSKQMNSLQPQRQEQHPQPNQTQFDNDPLAPYVAEQGKAINALNDMVRNIQKQSTRQVFDATVKAIAATHKDFDQFVKPHEIEIEYKKWDDRGQAHLVQWDHMLDSVYKARAFEHYKKAADELATMRAAKAERAKTTAAAAQVPTGGSPFQQPERQLDPEHRGYDDALANAKAALRELGG